MGSRSGFSGSLRARLIAPARTRRRDSSSVLLVVARAVRPSTTARTEMPRVCSATFWWMVLLAKRVSASTVASISISVSSASLQRIMRSARCSSSAAVKRAPLGWFEDCGAAAFCGRLVADFFLALAIFSFCSRSIVTRSRRQRQNRLRRRRGPAKRNWPLQQQVQQPRAGETPADRQADRRYFAKATPTLIFLNRAGEAPWPVPMVCIGWPLPQLGVPQSVQWSREQIASQLFQNSVVMPL